MNHHYHKFSHFGLIGRSDPCRSVLPQASRAVLTKDLVVCSHTPSCLVESPLCGLTFQTLKQETESKQRLRIASRISFTQLTMRLGNLYNSRRAMIPDRPNMIFLPHVPQSRFLDAKHILRGNLAQMCTIAASSGKFKHGKRKVRSCQNPEYQAILVTCFGPHAYRLQQIRCQVGTVSER